MDLGSTRIEPEEGPTPILPRLCRRTTSQHSHMGACSLTQEFQVISQIRIITSPSQASYVWAAESEAGMRGSKTLPRPCIPEALCPPSP